MRVFQSRKGCFFSVVGAQCRSFCSHFSVRHAFFRSYILKRLLLLLILQETSFATIVYLSVFIYLSR